MHTPTGYRLYVTSGKSYNWMDVHVHVGMHHTKNRGNKEVTLFGPVPHVFVRKNAATHIIVALCLYHNLVP